MLKSKKKLEAENKHLRKMCADAFEAWATKIEELLDARAEISKLKAELAEAEEENEKLFEEITELKAKYTAEVQKNYELIQKIDMLEG